MNSVPTAADGHQWIRHTLVLAALLWMTGCGRQETMPEMANELEPPSVAGMTVQHNSIRAAVDPPAEPALDPLTWSSEVAATARNWAAQCRFEHNSNRGRLGENIAAFTDSTGSADETLQQWAAESADYDWASNRCAAGRVCGHYTQVVWRGSRRLGCGMAECTTGSPFEGFERWQLWVCNYDPPGNVERQRPY